MKEFQLLSLHKPESLTVFHLNGTPPILVYVYVNCAMPHFTTDSIIR